MLSVVNNACTHHTRCTQKNRFEEASELEVKNHGPLPGINGHTWGYHSMNGVLTDLYLVRAIMVGFTLSCQSLGWQNVSCTMAHVIMVSPTAAKSIPAGSV